MAAVTLADLRCELRRFAEADLRKEFAHFGTTKLPECLETTLKKVIGEGLSLNASDFVLPGQTAESCLRNAPAPTSLPDFRHMWTAEEDLQGKSSCPPRPPPAAMTLTVSLDSEGKVTTPKTPRRTPRSLKDETVETLAWNAVMPSLSLRGHESRDPERKAMMSATSTGRSVMPRLSLRRLEYRDPERKPSSASSTGKSSDRTSSAWKTVMPRSALMGYEFQTPGVGRKMRRSNALEELKNNEPNAENAILRDSSKTMAEFSPGSGFVLTGNREYLRSIIEGSMFEYFMASCIMLNAILMGVDTDLRARDASAENRPVFVQLDAIMLIVFSIDIAARFYVFRSWIFWATTPSGAKNNDQLWTIFDSIIVGIGIVSWVVEFATESDLAIIGNLSVVRLFRLVRLGRLLRMGKVLRMVADLRKIIHSVVGTANLFFWVTLLLSANVYTFALYFTEVVASQNQQGSVSDDIRSKFGSLWLTQRTLVASITGGIDWLDVYVPLMNELGHFLVDIPFFLYLSFSLCCLLNVTLGLFMDAASGLGQQATEAYLLQQALDIFQAADDDDDGKIEIHDFESVLTHPGISDFFNTIDLDQSQAHILFQLLDISGDGLVSCAEFLHGCLRVRGTAKALDLLVLSREVTQIFERTHREHAADTETNRHILLDLAEAHMWLLEQFKEGAIKPSEGMNRESSDLSVRSELPRP